MSVKIGQNKVDNGMTCHWARADSMVQNQDLHFIIINCGCFGLQYYTNLLYTLYNNVAPSMANRGNPAIATLGVAIMHNTMLYNKIILDIASVYNWLSISVDTGQNNAGKGWQWSVSHATELEKR